MKQLELFAGIGGFGLAGHWAGIETVCQVEIDPFCQKVLAKNFPNAQRHDDIKTFDGSQWRGVDIISGGFPCQPYSSAGKRLGTADERHLWPEMLRVIREASPRWVVGENVGGLINWSDGLVFEQVCADLEAEGYEVQPFILPACAVNAPHRRDRVWFIAHANTVGQSIGRQQFEPVDAGQPCRGFNAQDATNAEINRLQGQRQPASPCDTKPKKAVRANTGNSNGDGIVGKPNWDKWTDKPGICRMDDGLSGWVDGYWGKRVKSLGNAIVPQVAYQIFQTIVEYENLQAWKK